MEVHGDVASYSITLAVTVTPVFVVLKNTIPLSLSAFAVKLKL